MLLLIISIVAIYVSFRLFRATLRTAKSLQDGQNVIRKCAKMVFFAGSGLFSGFVGAFTMVAWGVSVLIWLVSLLF